MKQEVVVGIVSLNDEILIIQRKYREGDLLWQFPGGKIEDGELAEEAVLREVLEETNIGCTLVKYLGKRIHPATDTKILYYACKYTSGEIAVCDNEVADAKWIKCHDISKYFTTPIFTPIIEYLKLLD